MPDKNINDLTTKICKVICHPTIVKPYQHAYRGITVKEPVMLKKYLVRCGKNLGMGDYDA